MEALNLMKNQKKAARPSAITSELLKVCKNGRVRKLSEVANDLLEGKRMLRSWRRSDLIPIYKEKGNVRSCGSYRSVKPLENMKWQEENFIKVL